MITAQEAINSLNNIENKFVDHFCESESGFNNLGEAVYHFDLVRINDLGKQFAQDESWYGPVQQINPLRIYNYMRFTMYGGIIFTSQDCENDNKDGCCLPNCCAYSLSEGKLCKDYNHEQYSTYNG